MALLACFRIAKGRPASGQCSSLPITGAAGTDRAFLDQRINLEFLVLRDNVVIEVIVCSRRSALDSGRADGLLQNWLAALRADDLFDYLGNRHVDLLHLTSRRFARRR